MGWLDVVAVITLVVIGYFIYRSKKNDALLLLAFLTLSAGWLPSQAASVSLTQARSTAASFLAGRQTATARGRAVSRLELKLVSSEGTGYYTFNASDGAGFVIVSGDDRLPAVLGYADEGSLPSDEQMPANLKAWLQGYSDQLAWLDSHRQEGGTPLAASATEGWKAIAPLLTTTWDQSAPYNLRCPLYTVKNPGTGESVTGHSATGCVATAMAQLMYYHRWPAQTTRKIEGYTTEYYKLEVSGWDAGITLEWDKMTPAYDNNSSAASQDAVATLLSCCGAAVGMEYGPSSGANDGQAARALRRYFGYDEGLRFMYRNDYSTDEWEKTVYNELASSRPVFYGGQSTGGGHAFVCDGYDQDGYFHINWGWGGHYNGYFLLSLVNPTAGGTGSSTTMDGYTIDQDMIIGLQPPTGDTVEPESLRLSATSLAVTSSPEINRLTGLLGFSLGVANNLTDNYDFDVAVGLFDATGQQVGTVWQGAVGTIKAGHFMKLESMTEYGAFSSLADGVYQLKLLSRPMGSSGDWLECLASEQHYLSAVVSGNQVVIGSPAKQLTLTAIRLEGSGLTSDIQTIVATIKNESEVAFRDVIYTYIDDELVMVGVDIEAGATEDVYITFRPSTVGQKTVRLYADEHQVQKIGEGVIGIEKKPEVVYTDGVDLEVTFGITGLHTVGGEKYITGNKLQANVVATNQTDENYKGYAILFLYTWQDTGDGFTGLASGVGQPITLDAHSSTELTFEYDVEVGGMYSLVAAWLKNGNPQSYNEAATIYDFFTVKEASEEPDPITTTVSRPSAPLADSQADVYTLKGVKAGKAGQLGQLPRGVYVVNGRKVVVR